MTVQKYIRILKDEDLWERYVYNYYHHPNKNNSGDIFKDMEQAIIQCKNAINSFSKGWNWGDSSEGVNFWEEKRRLINIKLLK